jgi:hypothetical protein
MCWPYQGSGRYGFDATILPAIARGFLAGLEAAAARLNEVHRRAHLMFRPRSPGRRAAAVPCGPEGSPPINLLRK